MTTQLSLPITERMVCSLSMNKDFELDSQGMTFLGLVSDIDGQYGEIHVFADFPEKLTDGMAYFSDQPLMATYSENNLCQWMRDGHAFLGVTECHNKLVYLFVPNSIVD